MIKKKWAYSNKNQQPGFTIVELLIVIVIIGILAALVIVAYNGIQDRAQDTARIDKVTKIARALEAYYADNGDYPHIKDGEGVEGTGCGSPTDNWGHCDRLKALTDAIAPYAKIDPTSLSQATQGNYYYRYDSQASNSWQSYALSVILKGTGGASDGGFFSNQYELGEDPKYCMQTYTGSNANWDWSSPETRCVGGN